MKAYTSEQILAVAQEAAAAAAAIITKHRHAQSFAVSQKGARDFVTSADLESDRAIVGVIKSHFPSHQILSEEQFPSLGASGLPSNPLWVIDPIDGTTNYVYGLHYVGISIAFFDQGAVQVGLVKAPFLSEEFTAIRGHGAFLNNQPIKARKAPDGLKGALVTTGFPSARDHVDALTVRIHNVLTHCQDLRRFGAASLDLCAVACGRLDAYYESVAPWDMAAGVLIAREAGAKFGHLSNYPRGPADTHWQSLPAELKGTAMLAAGAEVFDELKALLELDSTEQR